MGDGLLGGRHHGVVGSDDDDGDIGHLGTTGTHGGERLVTRGIKEGDATAVLQFHVVGSDVLRDTACLTSDDVGIAHVVEERCLTVVHMAHDGDDRSTGDEVILIILHLLDGLLHLSGDILGGVAKLVSDEIDGLSIKTLIDGHHDAY